MIERKATGRIRYRVEKPWFRKHMLVLQVQIHVTGYSIEYPGMPVDVDEKYWRDADTTDLPGWHFGVEAQETRHGSRRGRLRVRSW